MITIPSGVIPVQDQSTRDILYGARSTSFRYELLEHDPATGVDSVIGFLDGVSDDDASIRWTSGTEVKKEASLSVVDLAAAASGLIRFAEVNSVTVRIRPVMVIEGLPEIPLGVYVVSLAPELWAGTGRAFSLELLEKTTVLEQDAVDETFTATTGASVLSIVQEVVESAGEALPIDGADVRELSSPLVWEAGTSKLRIVNDLLAAISYNSLWMDGLGTLRATPYVAPGSRSVRYSVLNDESGNRLQRELVDGPESIYLPEWTRDRDSYGVPNKVVAVAAGSGDAPPLAGIAENTDPSSPYSIPSRGRTIVRTLTGVDVPDLASDALTIAFLEGVAQRSLTAASAVQASVSVKCLPIPVELLDAVIFASAPAGINARHTVRSVSMPLRFDAVMALELQEVL